MREMIRLIVTVLAFSAFSGGLLAALHNGTQARIEYQVLKFVKGPTIKQIMAGAANDPLTDRFKVTDGEIGREFYVGVFEGKPKVVAFESFGKGYEGELGVIVAVNIENDEIVGIGVTTHRETPGVGARVKTDPSFAEQFKGLPLKEPFKIRPDGGQIDAISGASFSSRGVCEAVTKATGIYTKHKRDIVEKLKSFKT
ncbi:MAG: FMN-binding protein [Deltaproteobacteria bacterium]|nr:FMN-binding protein [Deltaproteobacteria bacterium]MBW2136640.1 FMN-binding protein [Deltaproteobacteria bacterium]